MHGGTQHHQPSSTLPTQQREGRDASEKERQKEVKKKK